MRQRGKDLVIRPARAADNRRLAQVGFAAFRVGEPARMRRYYRENHHRRPPDTLVAMRGATMVGCASALRLKMTLCGQDVPFAGIAAVAVVPECRRQNVADVLMRDVLAHARAQGFALSLLYAFRESFYRKFGYGVVETWDVLRVAPSQLPDSPLRRQVRRATAKDVPAMKRVYEQQRAGTTGQLARSAWWWKRRVLEYAPDHVVYVDDKSRRVTGYLIYDVPEEPAFPHQLCRVAEIRATDGAAYRGLLGFLAALGDQYKAVELELLPGDARWVQRHHGIAGMPQPVSRNGISGFLGGGAMLRILDVARALALHPAPTQNGVSGEVGLELSDPIFADNNRSFDVTFTKKGARVRAGRRASERVAMPMDAFAQIYSGGVSARRLLATGFIDGSERAAAILDEAFRGPVPYLGSRNGF